MSKKMIQHESWFALLRRRAWRIAGVLLVGGFVGLNVLAYQHARDVGL
jgi:hypothetical protein